MGNQVSAKKSLWWRILRWLFRGAVGLFVVALLVRMVSGYVIARQLRDEIAKIRAAGEPVTFQDLQKGVPEVPGSANAGRFYAAAMALLPKTGPENLDRVLKGLAQTLEGWPTSRPASDVQQQAMAILDEHRLVYELCDQAAAMPACRFDFGPNLGMTAHMERLSRTRRVALLLSLRTRALALAEKGDQAVDAVICSLRMLRIFDGETIMVTELVRLGIVMVACRDAAVTLEAGRPSDPALARLLDALGTTEKPDALTRTIQGERVFILASMRDLLGGRVGAQLSQDAGIHLPSMWVGSFWGRPLAGGWAVGLLRDLADMVRASPDPWPKVLDSMAVDPSVERSFFGGMLVAPMARVAVQLGQAIAMSRSVETAIMVEQYRRANDRLPASLRDLAPDSPKGVPVDPFSGKPLVYRQDDAGFVVYSIGDDRKDDGGAVDSNEQNRRPDWGIRVRLNRDLGPGG